MIPRLIPASVVFLLAALGAQAVIVDDPNIRQYGVGKRKGYVQTGPGQVAFANFTFEAFVDLKPGGSVLLATLQGPLLGGTQTLSITQDGVEYQSVQFTGDPTTAKGNLNGNFSDSTPGNAGTNYSLSFTTGANAVYSASFSLTGETYATTAPTFTLDNGSWNNGIYVLDPTQATHFGWAFSDYNAATDIVLFNVKPKTGGSELVEQQFQGNNPGGYTVNANQLTPGGQYIGELTFARLVDTSTTTVPGAQGFAFYALETSFEFTAIPEPSTYVLLMLGFGLVGRAVRRRR